MELVQIFVLGFALFGILCNATRRTLLKYHTDRSGEHNHESSNCICLPKVENAQLLPDLIDPKGVGIERLVIYFYINPQTYEITAYTPNVEKQLIFPDLPLDVGDNLVPVKSDENVINFVIFNPNKVVRTTVRHDPNNVMVNENPSDSITNVPNIPNISEMHSIDTPKDLNFPALEPIVDGIINTPNAINGVISPGSNEEIHIRPDTNIKIIDINQQKPNTQNLVNQLLPTQEPVITLQNINEVPLNNILDGWQTDSINNIFKWKGYVLNDMDHQPAIDIQNVQRPGYLQFDQWFQQQMNSPLNKENSINFPDDNVLKSLVYKNLFQKGIISMDNGILKTHQGDTLNLSNLKLQPILVGLLDYNYPTTGVRNKIVPPYYDAMALYMNHPQKILGIIPMSSDYSPNSIGYTSMNVKKIFPNVVSSRLLKTHCINGKCYTSTMAKDFPLRSGKPEKKEKAHEDSDEGRSTQDADKEIIKIYRGTGNQLGYLNINQLENINKRKAKRIPVATDLLSKLYGIMLGEEADRKAGKKTSPYEVSAIEDEGPDFRIVGGSAATGSGTPVSSRGRSVFN
ncbi:uncharacterized protein LOC115445550 [Manduca sexta]|uniref:uncharacterized protein LOC115445550 n=1 Tax=Manduca sexta TaxID=7130 RepID=UPI001183157F|nr:uncharacterized protein LOC115445550 [Manduca sexta]